MSWIPAPSIGLYLLYSASLLFTPLHYLFKQRKMNIVEADASVEDLLAQDPTIQLNGVPDEANGSKPDPPTRYGQPLPPEWIPLYRKPMRTPTRKLRVVSIGAGISAMNLAYKVYHEHSLIENGIVESLKMYEANEDLGGTWLVNTYPGVACDGRCS